MAMAAGSDRKEALTKRADFVVGVGGGRTTHIQHTVEQPCAGDKRIELKVLRLPVIKSVAHQIMSPILAPVSCCGASAACAKDQEPRISTERQYKACYDQGIALLHHRNTTVALLLTAHYDSKTSRGIGTTDYRLYNYTI